jgi:hypothetical protein
MKTTQNDRIKQCLLDSPFAKIPAPVLHNAAAVKPYGYCGSLSRRISDLRESGMDIVMSDEYEGRERHTFYEYQP